MVTLTEFYAKVSAELRRGTTFDSLIPAKAQLACNWMEKQHTFMHMEYFGDVAITQGVREIGLPAGFKKMFFWRIIKEDGSYRYLPKINPKDASALTEEMPNAYWQNAKQTTIFDATPDKDYDSERSYVGYTVFGGGGTSPEALQLYELVIFHQTCVLLSTTMRDGSFGTAHKGLRDEAMKAAIDADIEERMSNENPQVQYGHEFIEEINALEATMTLEVKHNFNCTIATDPAATSAGKVTPEKWNEAHVLTQATGKILGRKTAGAGATEELSTAEVLELIDTCARGDILFRGASAWTRLAAGTYDGMSLVTEGSDEDPRWGYRNAFAQASAPTVGDDSGDGFEVGSCWFTTGGAVYVCTDATVGAAVWLKWLTPADATPVGTISDTACATAPSGWLLCYGQAVSRTTYADLFAAIGTTFGTGDGSTTFNIPDLRGRVTAGQDDMGGTSANRLTGISGGVNGDTFGAAGGEEAHTMTEAELATHYHNNLQLPVSEDDNPDPPLNIGLIGNNNANGGLQTMTSGQTGSAGSNTPFNVVQPTLILNKMIKY